MAKVAPISGVITDMKRTIIIICYLLSLTSPVIAGPANYCTDQETNQTWERMLIKYGDIPEWKELYRLRKTLCAKVEAGTIELAEAIEIFERERHIKANRLKRRMEKTESANNSLSG